MDPDVIHTAIAFEKNKNLRLWDFKEQKQKGRGVAGQVFFLRTRYK